IRQDPKAAISQKFEYLRWLQEQIESGLEEQLSVRVIEATCFPWGRRTSWETCATDECIRLLTLGHFSRTELVRSFLRTSADPLATVYEVRMRGEQRPSPRCAHRDRMGSSSGAPSVGWLARDVAPSSCIRCIP